MFPIFMGLLLAPAIAMERGFSSRWSGLSGMRRSPIFIEREF